MLDMAVPLDTCQGELLMGMERSKRKKCIAISKIDFGVFPAGLQSCFGPYFLNFLLHFVMLMYVSVPLYVGSMCLLFAVAFTWGYN